MLPRMILHTVLLRPRADATPDELAACREAVLDLGEQLDEVRWTHWGPDVSTEGLRHDFSVGFVMAFADAAARDAYLVHPAHAPVGARVRAVAADVLVVDLEADRTPAT
jgi:hypothetical protein